MNKEQILNAIKEGLSNGVITERDVQNVSNIKVQHGTSTASQEGSSTLVSKVLYALGGIIALIGIVVLINDNWQELGIVGRLLVTLGFSLVTYIAAMVLHQKRIQDALVQIFFVLSAAVSPIAAFTLLDSLGVADPYTVGSQIRIAIVLFLIYGTALYVTKRNILHVITGLLFSWGYFATIGWILKSNAGGWSGDAIRDVTVYAAMILGFAFLAYSTWVKALIKGNSSAWGAAGPALTRVASAYSMAAFIFVLWPALTLVGVWDLLYAFLALGSVMLSINLRTTSGLVITAVSIGIYVIHMSSKYFANSVGWATVLVVIGFLIIGLGYLTYYLNKKYIAKA